MENFYEIASFVLMVLAAFIKIFDTDLNAIFVMTLAIYWGIRGLGG